MILCVANYYYRLFYRRNNHSSANYVLAIYSGDNFLDSTGASSYSLPAGSLPPNLPAFYAVTRTFGPFLQTITETSNITSLTPLPAPNIIAGPALSTGPVTPASPLVRLL